MPKRGSILVAVRDLDASSTPFLRKAAQVAKALNADVHLLHAIPIPCAPVMAGNAQIRNAVQEQIRDSERELEALARSAHLRGLRVRSTAIWDYPAADAIVRAVMKYRPSLLLIQSEHHNRLARAVLSNTDWELIRHCPCPVWVSKQRTLSLETVLAAVDPFHAHGKPGALEDAVLKQAIELASGKVKRVLAAHAVLIPAALGGEGAIEPYWIPLTAKEIDVYETSTRKRLAALASKHHIPAENQIVAIGDPISQLPRLAKRYRAGVVVMGAVSRSGLKRLFIGNTAERIIDSLNTDLLVVKPRGFKTPVKRVPARIRPLVWPPI